MITIKKKIKKTLKNRPFLFFIAKTILNILNLNYILIFFKFLFHQIRIHFCYLFQTKIEQDFFLNAGISPTRLKDLEELLNLQITKFLKKKHTRKFCYIEVGVFLGQTTEVLGSLLKKRLGDNFEIIVIDPFTPYTKTFPYDFIISSVDKYFIHNMKVKGLFKYLYFIKNLSSVGFKILKDKKTFYDFCFVDGSHKYHDILKDINNFSEIRFIEHGNKYYNGVLVGDDYEFSYKELCNIDKKKEKILLNLKKNNLFNDSMVTYENHWFHPGVTFAIHDSALKINKTTNGLWILK